MLPPLCLGVLCALLLLLDTAGRGNAHARFSTSSYLSGESNGLERKSSLCRLKRLPHNIIWAPPRLEKIDLEKLQNLTTEQFKREISSLVDQISEEEKLMVNQLERRQLALDMQYEMLGFGPIEPLMADPTVSDILVNTYSKIYVERRGRLELTPVTFNDNAHLLKVIEKIVSRIGRRIDESSPMVDARLPDGSRVNAIIPLLAIDRKSVV